MKRTLVLLSIMLACVGSILAVNRVFTVSKSFVSLKTQGNVEVVYTVGDKVEVVATTEADYMQYVSVSVVNDGLVIGYSPEGNKPPKATVAVTGPGIPFFVSEGNSSIVVNGNVDAMSFAAQSSGNSHIEFKGNAGGMAAMLKAEGNSSIEVDGSFKVGSGGAVAKGNSTIVVNAIDGMAFGAQAQGNSTITASGSAGQGVFVAQGNSTINAADLKVEQGKIQAEGNSTLRCNVAKVMEETHSNNATLVNKQ